MESIQNRGLGSVNRFHPSVRLKQQTTPLRGTPHAGALRMGKGTFRNLWQDYWQGTLSTTQWTQRYFQESVAERADRQQRERDAAYINYQMERHGDRFRVDPDTVYNMATLQEMLTPYHPFAPYEQAELLRYLSSRRLERYPKETLQVLLDQGLTHAFYQVREVSVTQLRKRPQADFLLPLVTQWSREVPGHPTYAVFEQAVQEISRQDTDWDEATIAGLVEHLETNPPVEVARLCLAVATKTPRIETIKSLFALLGLSGLRNRLKNEIRDQLIVSYRSPFKAVYEKALRPRELYHVKHAGLAGLFNQASVADFPVLWKHFLQEMKQNEARSPLKGLYVRLLTLSLGVLRPGNESYEPERDATPVINALYSGLERNSPETQQVAIRLLGLFRGTPSTPSLEAILTRLQAHRQTETLSAMPTEISGFAQEADTSFLGRQLEHQEKPILQYVATLSLLKEAKSFNQYQHILEVIDTLPNDLLMLLSRGDRAEAEKMQFNQLTSLVRKSNLAETVPVAALITMASRAQRSLTKLLILDVLANTAPLDPRTLSLMAEVYATSEQHSFARSVIHNQVLNLSQTHEEVLAALLPYAENPSAPFRRVAVSALDNYIQAVRPSRETLFTSVTEPDLLLRKLTECRHKQLREAASEKIRKEEGYLIAELSEEISAIVSPLQVLTHPDSRDTQVFSILAKLADTRQKQHPTVQQAAWSLLATALDTLNQSPQDYLSLNIIRPLEAIQAQFADHDPQLTQESQAFLNHCQRLGLLPQGIPTPV